MPRSRAHREMGPRGRRPACAQPVLRKQRMGTRPAMSKRIGPSTSTEPGWMAAAGEPPYYLGSAVGQAANDPSMLLSFERPAPAGSREVTPARRDHQRTETSRRSCLSTVLENCTEATSAAIDKRRLNNGYHRALCDRNASQKASRTLWARSPSR